MEGARLHSILGNVQHLLRLREQQRAVPRLVPVQSAPAEAHASAQRKQSPSTVSANSELHLHALVCEEQRRDMKSAI